MDNPAPPPIFCEQNRHFWEVVRRFMLALLHELDRAYGWQTIGGDGNLIPK